MTPNRLREAEARYGAGSPTRPDCAEYDDALRLLDELISEEAAAGTLAQARNLRWHIRYLRGDPDGALEDLSEAIALRPTWGAPRYNRGYLHAIQGRLSEARTDFETALRIARETQDDDLMDAAEVRLADLDRRSEAP